MKKIAVLLGSDFSKVIKDMYLDKKMCPKEISDSILKNTGIQITPRSIQRKVKELGINRSKSEAFSLAINRGRKDYGHLRKPIKSEELRKGINLKLRYQVLKRDDFKCVLCGTTAKNDILVVDHKKPVVAGGDNSMDNLRTLCRSCNHGKMLAEDRYS